MAGHRKVYASQSQLEIGLRLRCACAAIISQRSRIAVAAHAHRSRNWKLSFNGMFTYTFETAFMRNLYFAGIIVSTLLHIWIGICNDQHGLLARQLVYCCNCVTATSTQVNMCLPACVGFYEIR
jgi:hypothetical protein